MGLLDKWIKKKTTAYKSIIVLPKTDTMGLLLFDRVDMSIELMEERIKQTFGEGSLINVDRSHPSTIHLLVRIEELDYLCSYMPFPVPTEEMDIAYTVQFNRLTPEEQQAFCEHRSFLIITQKGGGSTLEGKRKVCRLYSKLCGVLMELEGAVGFCMNSTGLLVSQKEYLRHVAILNGEAGQSPDYFPAPLWIWVLPLEQDGTPTIETWGLKEFGFSELQFYNPKTEPAEIFSRLYMMSILEITEKEYYKNMDTITFTEGEQSIFKQNGEKLLIIGS